MVLRYEVHDVLLQKFLIYFCQVIVNKTIWTRPYQNRMLFPSNTCMCWKIYLYRTLDFRKELLQFFIESRSAIFCFNVSCFFQPFVWILFDILIVFHVKCLSTSFFKNLYETDFHLPKKIYFMCFNESPLKRMDNAFYSILEALFVLKIFKLLPWSFIYLEKKIWLEI